MAGGRARVSRTGAAALVEALEGAGVRTVFGYPGGGILDVFDALSRSSLELVLGRHEQGLVHMADGYARSTGRPGIAIVTSGPGLTNTVTGLGAANMDGVPLVLVSGQVPLSQIGTDAFQEADSTGITRAVTKHNFLVHSADELPATVAEAFYIATHGKPGPVVIDVPVDCQRRLTAAPVPERVVLRAYPPAVAATAAERRRFVQLLAAARRPVLYAGGGVIAAGVEAELAELAQRAQVPVATSLMGLGAFDEAAALSLGMSGRYGTAVANRAIAEADLLVALGVRFNDRSTGNPRLYARRARVVHVDIDPSSIGKNVEVELGIAADLREFLPAILPSVPPAEHGAWLRRLDEWRRQERRSIPAARGLSPQAVIAAVAELAGGGAQVVTDVGQHQLWAARHWPHRTPRRFFTSGGMGAMGFGIPAAIGAALAHPELKTVAFVGDGGAQMTANELIVAAERRLPLLVVVFANARLGLIRQLQDTYFGARRFASELSSPDYLKLAAAYSLKAFRIRRLGELRPVLKRAWKCAGPVLVEVAIDPEANVQVSGAAALTTPETIIG